MSDPTNILPLEPSSFNLTPEAFDGDKAKYKNFIRQLSLAFRAAPSKFCTHDARIIFTLHHMTGGFAADFANAYVDKWQNAEPNSVTWDEFKASLDACFGDSTSQRQAMVDIAKFTQGRLSVTEFFTKFESMALLAGYDTDTHFQYLTTLLTNNLNEKLVNSFYNTEELPTTFAGWKSRLVKLEQVWMLRRAAERPLTMPSKPLTKPGPVPFRAAAPSLPVKGAGDPMHVDALKTKPSVQCYRCRGYGHLASSCPTPGPSPATHMHVRALEAEEDLVPASEDDPRDAEIALLKDKLENAMKLLKEKGF